MKLEGGVSLFSERVRRVEGCLDKVDRNEAVHEKSQGKRANGSGGVEFKR